MKSFARWIPSRPRRSLCSLPPVPRGRRKPRRGGSHEFLPSLEGLEDRVTPSTAPIVDQSLTQLSNGPTSVTTNAVPDQPPTAVDDHAATKVQQAIDIPVLSNDFDPDGTLDPNSITIVSGPSHGNLHQPPPSSPALATPESGITVGPGHVSYTPEAGFVGTDSFKYTVKDNAGLVSNVATVTVLVSPNQPPVATDDSGTVRSGGTVSLDVAGNDSRPRRHGGSDLRDDCLCPRSRHRRREPGPVGHRVRRR